MDSRALLPGRERLGGCIFYFSSGTHAEASPPPRQLHAWLRLCPRLLVAEHVVGVIDRGWALQTLRVTVHEAEGLRNVAVLKKTDSYVCAHLSSRTGAQEGRTSVKKVGWLDWPTWRRAWCARSVSSRCSRGSDYAISLERHLHSSPEVDRLIAQDARVGAGAVFASLTQAAVVHILFVCRALKEAATAFGSCAVYMARCACTPRR